MIGIYDSGVGGMHILKNLQLALPEASFIYLADMQMMPLGEHTAKNICSRLECACEWFFTKKNCSIVLLACNTASVVGIRHLQQRWLPKRFPKHNVLGINIPMLEYVSLQCTDFKDKPGIILSTVATHATRFYEQELRDRGFRNAYGVGSSRLAQAVEFERIEMIQEELAEIKKHANHMCDGEPAYIVQACTHFPLIHTEIERVFPTTYLIDHAPYVARQLRNYLGRHPEYVQEYEGKRLYVSTANPNHVKDRAHALFGWDVEVEKVSL